MKKNIKIKIDKNNKPYLLLADFSDFIDISLVKTYKIKEKNDSFLIEFYDKDGKIIILRKD
jgi:hypothetical protein